MNFKKFAAYAFGTVLTTITLLCVLSFSPSARAQSSSTSFGLGFNYTSSSSPYGLPITSYGSGANSFGALGSLCGGGYSPIVQSACGCQSSCNSCSSGCPISAQPSYSFGAPSMLPPPQIPQMPALQPLPPPPPLLPVALQNQPMMQNGCSLQRPVIPGPTYGTNCVPCQAGMVPQQVSPVPGGPLLANEGNYEFVRVGPINEWEKDDTAAIISAEARGMASLTTNVRPYDVDRFDTTLMFQTPFYDDGSRDTGLIPRPTH